MGDLGAHTSRRFVVVLRVDRTASPGTIHARRRRDAQGREAAGEQPHRSHGAARTAERFVPAASPGDRAAPGRSARRRRARRGGRGSRGWGPPSRHTGAEVARVVALAVVRPHPGAGPILRLLATRTRWSGAPQQLLVLGIPHGSRRSTVAPRPASRPSERIVGLDPSGPGGGAPCSLVDRRLALTPAGAGVSRRVARAAVQRRHRGSEHPDAGRPLRRLRGRSAAERRVTSSARG